MTITLSQVLQLVHVSVGIYLSVSCCIILTERSDNQIGNCRRKVKNQTCLIIAISRERFEEGKLFIEWLSVGHVVYGIGERNVLEVLQQLIYD